MRTIVTAGETIVFPIVNTGELHEFVVGPRHETDKTLLVSGAWGCVTHGQVFANNLQASIHESEGDHEVVWLCIEHGPEVP